MSEQHFSDCPHWYEDERLPCHCAERRELNVQKKAVEAWRQDAVEQAATIVSLRAEVARLEQFKAWAEPQIVTHGDDLKQIEELKERLRQNGNEFRCCYGYWKNEVHHRQTPDTVARWRPIWDWNPAGDSLPPRIPPLPEPRS